ncbi:MAG: DUF4405 domain-containing protein [Micromonosporaceae bacterium]
MTQAADQNLAQAAGAAPAVAPADGATVISRRRRVSARTRLDFWFDAVLLVAYTLAYSVGFTRLAIHEWLGIGLGLALLVHLALHWDWVIRTTRRLLSRRGRDRIVWLVNVALMISMTLCVASGILISQVALGSLGVRVSSSGFWGGLHGTTAGLTLVLVPVHAALRWRWIVSVASRLMHLRPARGPR